MEDLDRLTAALVDRYQIEREIGEGGMAAVFLAQDLKHHRKVAVKVLKPELAAVIGAQRFLAEIETTANLIHPHILPLHDSGEADGFLFFVMPFVKGKNLRNRLDFEHQLPVAEAVRIVSELAEALDYAHRNGVVHRDIKPANVLMHEGWPLVADFGIARVVGSAGGARLTETGLSLGTPHYMSPEQATGDQAVGPASDIFALGCMLYELLVGEPPYVAATAQAVLGKIISGGHVSATDQRPSIPANVDGAIRKALEKLPADRFQSGRDFAKALGDPTFRHGERATVAPGHWKGIALGSAAVAVVFALTSVWSLTQPQPEMPITRIFGRIPEDQALLGGFDISADGTFMVYSGRGETEADTVLWVREWGGRDAWSLPNSRTSFPPAISPDGTQVAFFDGETIQIVTVDGRPVRSVGGRPLSSGVFRWSREGEWIYFQDNAGPALYRVPTAGGNVQLVENFPSASSQWWIYFDLLPSGEGAIVQIADREGPKILALDLRTLETTPLADGEFPRYANGLLFFVDREERRLMSMPFDPERMMGTGGAVPVETGILMDPEQEWWYFAASQTGTLLSATGTVPTMTAELVWVTRTGEVTSVDPDWTFDPSSDNRGLSLHPDGSRVVVSALSEDGSEDVLLKWLDGTPIFLTTGPASDVRPRWMPDDQSVSFVSTTDGYSRYGVFRKEAAPTGDPVEVLRHGTDLYEAIYSPDGEYLVVRTGVGPGSLRRDILGFKLGTDSVIPVTETEFNESAVSFSPDGRFLVYESDETGQTEVYVQSFPEVGQEPWPVSTDGGVMPLWSQGGGEIFFIDAEARMTVATVETDPTFAITGLTPLFPIPEGILFEEDEWYTLYDFAPEDDRFIMIRVREPEKPEIELTLKENWLAEVVGR